MWPLPSTYAYCRCLRRGSGGAGCGSGLTTGGRVGAGHSLTGHVATTDNNRLRLTTYDDRKSVSGQRGIEVVDVVVSSRSAVTTLDDVIVIHIHYAYS